MTFDDLYHFAKSKDAVNRARLDELTRGTATNPIRTGPSKRIPRPQPRRENPRRDQANLMNEDGDGNQDDGPTLLLIIDSETAATATEDLTEN